MAPILSQRASARSSAATVLRLAIVLITAAHCTVLQAQTSQGFVQQVSFFNGWSEFGVSVAISGDTAVVGSPNESNGNASESGAAYVFVRSGNTWTQQARLQASNAGAYDRFGWAVAISGNTVVVGAYAESSDATGVNGSQFNNDAIASGAAYVFVRSGTTWTQQAYFKASNSRRPDGTFSGGWFGISVAISGDTVVVGATGEDSSATGVNGDQGNLGAENSGAAYVFFRNGTTWAQQAYLKASNTGGGDRFGNSVAVSGDTIAVGAPDEDSNATAVNGDQNNNAASSSGAAYVFFRNGTTWAQQAYLKASNTGGGDGFGRVAVSGDTVVVGAGLEDSSDARVNGDQNNNAAGNSGAAYVFVRDGANWTQEAYLKASNARRDDRFGISVAVSGDTVVVGAVLEDSNTTGTHDTPDSSSGFAFDSGAAYVFARQASTWIQQAYIKASDTRPGAYFGVSVAISGEAIIVGASGDGNSSAGLTAYIFSALGGATTKSYALPQIAFGGGWTTTLYFSNTGANTANFTVEFYKDDGTAMSIPVSSGTASAVPVTVAPGATVQLPVSSSAALVTGWAGVKLPSGMTGFGIFKQSVADGRPDQEAVVPLSDDSKTSFALIWDDAGFSTAASIANTTDAPVTVTMTVRDGAGSQIGTGTVGLGPKQKRAFVLRDQLNLPAMIGGHGTVDISAGGAKIALLGLRFGPVAFTSIPPAEK